MTTIIVGNYEWDDVKATANAGKHGVTFSEAATALDDAKALDLPENPNPKARENVHTLARGHDGILFIVWTVGDEQRSRLISARRADPAEEEKYVEHVASMV
jgi:hypothetical protein